MMRLLTVKSAGWWLRLEILRTGKAPLQQSMWLYGHLPDKTQVYVATTVFTPVIEVIKNSTGSVHSCSMLLELALHSKITMASCKSKGFGDESSPYFEMIFVRTAFKRGTSLALPAPEGAPLWKVQCRQAYTSAGLNSQWLCLPTRTESERFNGLVFSNYWMCIFETKTKVI